MSNVYAKIGIQGDAEAEEKLKALDQKANAETAKLEGTVNSKLLEAAKRADDSGESIKNQLDMDIDAAIKEAGIDTTACEMQAKEIMARIAMQTNQTSGRTQTEAQKIYALLTEVDLRVEMTKQKAAMVAHQVASIVHHSYSMLTQVLGIFGVSIPPVLGAAISAVFSMATLLIQSGSGMLSNPYTAAIGAMAIASAVISIASAIEAQNKQNEIESRMKNIEKYANARISVTFTQMVTI